MWKLEPPPDDYKKTVATCWVLTAGELQGGALELLHLCAFLGPEAIPRLLPVRGAEHLPEALQSAVTDELRYDECVQRLQSFSLIDVKDRQANARRLAKAERHAWAT